MSKIYIVEDDENIRELALYALNSAGFETAGFETGASFFERLESDANLSDANNLPDLVILDIMLPETDGLAILSKIRGDAKFSALPAIMMTAKDSELDKVKGLDAGADDYIAKPFGVMELISRIKAVLRRSRDAYTEIPEATNNRLIYKNIELDPAKRALFVKGRKETLTFKEYELLRYLMLNAEIALTRNQIMTSVWGNDFLGETRTVDVHIKMLRRKLGEEDKIIKTIRNVGYVFGG